MNDAPATRINVVRQPDGGYQCDPDSFEVIADETGAITGFDHRASA